MGEPASSAKDATSSQIHTAYSRIRRQLLGELLWKIGPNRKNKENIDRLFSDLPTMQEMTGDTPNAAVLQKSVAEFLTLPDNELWIRYYLAYPINRKNTEQVNSLLNYVDYQKKKPDDVPTIWEQKNFSNIKSGLRSMFMKKAELYWKDGDGDGEKTKRAADASLCHFVAYFTLLVSPGLEKRIEKVPEKLSQDEYLESHSLTAFGFRLAVPFLLTETIPTIYKNSKVTTFGLSSEAEIKGLSFWSLLPRDPMIAFAQAIMLGVVIFGNDRAKKKDYKNISGLFRKKDRKRFYSSHELTQMYGLPPNAATRMEDLQKRISTLRLANK